MLYFLQHALRKLGANLHDQRFILLSGIQSDSLNLPYRHLSLLRIVDSDLRRTFLMYIEARSPSSMISLMLENDVGEGRNRQHPDDTEPKVEAYICIISFETI
jgi:hypothetical protein